ncbi:MAG: alpha-amylase, partial [Duncaniella sp.]|nr:alpha-amylase [Duncaniella sp.]
VVSRGEAGAAVVNFSDSPAEVAAATTLPAGDYKDALTGAEFTVSQGVLKGTAQPLTSYILYAE